MKLLGNWLVPRLDAMSQQCICCDVALPGEFCIERHVCCVSPLLCHCIYTPSVLSLVLHTDVPHLTCSVFVRIFLSELDAAMLMWRCR